MFKIFGLVVLVIFISVNFAYSTPLDDYVNAPDSNYGYKLIKTYNMTGYTLYILNFTSQKWYDESVSSQPIWWHYLCITVPEIVTKRDAAFLFIDGGNNTERIPQPTDNFLELTSMFAVSTGAISADLQQIPNSPIIFKNDPSKKIRSDEAIIAWTWKAFIDNPNDPYILARLPMTKATVRAMDAVSNFTEEIGVAKLQKFFLAGASKRGWTTWTTMAVDKRVFAAIPIVLDILNMNNNFHRHYRSLGGWTFAFKDYHEVNVTQHIDTLQMFEMQKIIDPIYYLDRYTNKKIMLINTGGDEFLMPDDADSFWSDLRSITNGTVLVRRLPNAEHSCAGHEISILFTLRTFFLSAYNNISLPSVSWIRPNNATHGITIVTVDILNGPTPINATVYYAHTIKDNRRDFRLIVADPNDSSKIVPQPVIWLSNSKIINTIQTSSTITYTVAFEKPLKGWFGFFFQISFPGPENTVLELSSEINIIPEIFPFPDCYRESCYGKLV